MNEKTSMKDALQDSSLLKRLKHGKTKRNTCFMYLQLILKETNRLSFLTSMDLDQRFGSSLLLGLAKAIK